MLSRILNSQFLILNCMISHTLGGMKRAVAVMLWALALTAPFGAQAPQKIVVESPTMKAGQMMPRDYTPDGRNVSPPLTWSNVPAAAKELAVVCEDFDAGNPPPWVHWVIYKIPAHPRGFRSIPRRRCRPRFVAPCREATAGGDRSIEGPRLRLESRISITSSSTRWMHRSI